MVYVSITKLNCLVILFGGEFDGIRVFIKMATISTASKVFAKAKDVLRDRLFNEQQITKLLPQLHEKLIEDPKYLAEIIDSWNTLFGSAGTPVQDVIIQPKIPPVAAPPNSSILARNKINMTNILADVEPDLLLLDPGKLFNRHDRIRNLGITNSLSEEWLLLYNAPRGLYLQDWVELTKKIYYVEEKIIDFLYDKKERKAMTLHPLVKSASVTEIDFDQIRTRYLFALRSGYKSLSHLYSVQTALNKPSLADLILVSNESFLSRFASYCSIEEYNSFSDMIKNHDIDEDDAEIFEKLAELSSLSDRNRKQGVLR